MVLTVNSWTAVSDADRTKERILDVALRLFAEEGTYRVPLTRIRIGAGQRNQSAVHYHFKNRDGLIHALVQQYSAPIAARRDALLAARRNINDPIETARAVFMPLAELLDGDWRQLAFLRVMGEVTTRPDLAFEDIAALVGPGQAERTTSALLEILACGPPLPEHLRHERIRAGAIMAMHSLAEHAVLRSGLGRPPLPTEVVLANLVDMYVGALLAPVSKSAMRVRRHARLGDTNP